MQALLVLACLLSEAAASSRLFSSQGSQPLKRTVGKRRPGKDGRLVRARCGRRMMGAAGRACRWPPSPELLRGSCSLLHAILMLLFSHSLAPGTLCPATHPPRPFVTPCSTTRRWMRSTWAVPRSTRTTA